MSQFSPSGEGALGMVSARSFPAIVGTADMMLKSSGVVLVGFEKIGGGYCTAIVRGGIADVRIAVEAGAETAQQFGQFVSKSVIPRPLPNLEAVLPISARFAELAIAPGESPFANRAVGLLETRGFPAMVGAADAMLKAASVELAAYETTGDGLCTAIIRGSVASVAVAVEAGMYEAERIGELHAIMVIPRALEDLERVMPLADHWVAQQAQKRASRVALPISVKTQEKEPIALPRLDEIPIEKPLELPVERSRSREGSELL
jgi:carbon dioxide concentrating mechanism protein CcmO